MTPAQLLKIIRTMPAHLPLSDTLEKPRHYDTHKDHWIGWLSEYGGPGYYGRSATKRDAAFVYNHIQNVGMLIYLAEGVRAPYDLIKLACSARLISTPPAGVRKAAQCRVVRCHLPWGIIERRLGVPFR